MEVTRKPLTVEEIRASLAGDIETKYPPILSPKQFAELIGVARFTVYEWLSRGRLKHAARRRGKHSFIWRDRAIQILFSGGDWDE